MFTIGVVTRLIDSIDACPWGTVSGRQARQAARTWWAVPSFTAKMPHGSGRRFSHAARRAARSSSVSLTRVLKMAQGRPVSAASARKAFALTLDHPKEA